MQSSDNEQSSAVVVSWEDPPNTLLTAAKNAFVGWAFNFRVRVLLKSVVIQVILAMMVFFYFAKIEKHQRDDNKQQQQKNKDG